VCVVVMLVMTLVSGSVGGSEMTEGVVKARPVRAAAYCDLESQSRSLVTSGDGECDRWIMSTFLALPGSCQGVPRVPSRGGTACPVGGFSGLASNAVVHHAASCCRLSRSSSADWQQPQIGPRDQR